VWNPGYDWAPAWVAWRSSPTYCGWAPLPPECRWNASVGFSWVNGNSAVSIGFGIGASAWYATTWDRFCDPHLYHHRLPRQRAEQFVRESNVQVANGQGVNIRGNNNTVIINNGITREEVQRHSREEIKRTEMRDVNSPAAAQSFQLEVDQTQPMRFERPVTGVVVGNAGIADVIVHDAKVLFVVGKSVGTTEIIAVDGAGKTVFSGTIQVRSAHVRDMITIQRGKEISTAICQSRCVPSVHSEGTGPGNAPAIIRNRQA
jgi:hypothetical protein